MTSPAGRASPALAHLEAIVHRCLVPHGLVLGHIVCCEIVPCSHRRLERHVRRAAERRQGCRLAQVRSVELDPALLQSDEFARCSATANVPSAQLNSRTASKAKSLYSDQTLCDSACEARARGRWEGLGGWAALTRRAMVRCSKLGLQAIAGFAGGGRRRCGWFENSPVKNWSCETKWSHTHTHTHTHARAHDRSNAQRTWLAETTSHTSLMCAGARLGGRSTGERARRGLRAGQTFVSLPFGSESDSPQMKARSFCSSPAVPKNLTAGPAGRKPSSCLAAFHSAS